MDNSTRALWVDIRNMRNKMLVDLQDQIVAEHV